MKYGKPVSFALATHWIYGLTLEAKPYLRQWWHKTYETENATVRQPDAIFTASSISKIKRAVGCYGFFDTKTSRYLRIGMSFSIPSRVFSYFYGGVEKHIRKLRALLRANKESIQIHIWYDLRCYSLERSLIFKHQPPYNVVGRVNAGE